MFPDEFHLHTLETILGVCPQLQPNVKVGGVLAGLMSRLAKCAAETPEARATSHPLFSHFSSTPRVVSVSDAQHRDVVCVAMRVRAAPQVVGQLLELQAFSKFSEALTQARAGSFRLPAGNVPPSQRRQACTT